MKKLLSAALALTIGATCSVGVLAGCGSSSKKDAKAVEEAIQYIRLLHEGDPSNTTSSYTVAGVAPGNGKNCDVSWSVSMPEGYDVKDYFSFSPMDEDNMITVYVSRGETDIEYTLTATAKSGKKSASYDFKRTLVGLGKIYTVAEIKALASTSYIDISGNKYYSTDGTNAAVIAVGGYIVDEGSWSDTYNNFTNVYIADTYTAESNKNSSDALQVYRLKTDEVYITGENDVERGVRVTLQGCLQLYSGKPELTYQGSTDCTCIGMAKVVKTETQRVDDALSNVNSAMEITVAGTYDLPAPSVKQVSFSWALKSGSAATLSGSQIVVATIPSSDATVVLTLTATCGSVSKTKDVTVTVKAPLTVGTSVSYNFEAVKSASGALTADSALALFKSVNGSSNLVSVTVSNVYQGAGTGGGKPNADGLLKAGSSSANGQFVLTFDKDVAKVEIKCHDFYAKSTSYPTNSNKISVNGSIDQLLPYNETASGEVMTFNLSTASKVVTIDTKARAYIFEIVVYFAA